MDDLRQMLLAKRSRVSLERALSSGSTLLNLACTDTPNGCYLPGGYYYLVGDSSSGKTFLTLGCLAEASQNPVFDKYRLIYDDVEGGALMDIEEFFGKQLAKRLEAPDTSEKGRSIYSTTIESFYYHLQDAIDAKKPFIYILDSQDGLSSKAQKEKFQEQRQAWRKGTDAAGSYGDGKAKYHSENLRRMVSQMRRMGSILIIVGQTRDNVTGFGFDKKTRAGGKALKFYANIEIWTSVVGKVKKRVLGKDRTIGAECLAEVRKNRVTGKTGKDRAVRFQFFYSLGLDDIGSCVDYLIEEERWPRIKTKKQQQDEGRKDREEPRYDAKDVLVQGTRDEIIAAIEEDGMENKVREAAAQLWEYIEAQCVPNRKRRYT